VSLAPNLTEILYALGLEKRVAAVTDFCDRPERARKKPRVGGMINPSLEAIVRIRPDLVVMTTDGNPAEFEPKLGRLGIKTHVFRATRLHELAPAVRELGEALSAGDAAVLLAGEIESFLNGLKERSNRRDAGSALFIVWPEPLIVAGEDTHIGDALTLLGFENIAAPAPGRYSKFSIEEVIRRSPEVIFIGRTHASVEDASVKLLKRLRGVRAVENGRVYYADDSLHRLSPGIIKGIEDMEKKAGGAEVGITGDTD